jgi:chromosome partitioning protein
LTISRLTQKSKHSLFGGKSLDETVSEIELSSRKYLSLDDRLTDYPLDADFIIFDTPASLKPMALLGLVACTHVLAPIKPEHKDTGAFAGFLEWYYEYTSEMRLNPKPKLMGFLPCRVDLQAATHRDILGLDKKGKPRSDIPYEETLPGIVQALGIHCYPVVRESNHYLTASGYGLPIHLYRPGLDVSNDINPVVNHIVKLIMEGE